MARKVSSEIIYFVVKIGELPPHIFPLIFELTMHSWLWQRRQRSIGQHRCESAQIRMKLLEASSAAPETRLAAQYASMLV